ncbi:MAG: hypothetical protein ACI9HK_001651 [Pirellulaceae bacterium]|jgi:hypothetical protein
MLRTQPFSLASLIVIILCSNMSAALAADQPNFLIIMADNCTFKDLPLSGGQNALTPNIDQLASQTSCSTNKMFVLRELDVPEPVAKNINRRSLLDRQ